MECFDGCSRAKDGGEARLNPAELSLLLGDRQVREALPDGDVASLLPPVGADVFRKVTPASLQDIRRRHDADRPMDKQHKPADQLTAGEPLPFFLGSPPPELLYTPLEELDPYYQSQKTFLVVSRGNIIHRFDADSSLYLLSPLNPLRTASTRVLLTHWFRWFILVTLLVNCLFMTPKLKESGVSEVMECVFVTIYSVELLLRVVSCGFCVGRFSFIRDAWNLLDLLVIVTSIPSLFLDFGKCSVLVTIPRVLKIFSVSPGLRRTVEALIQSLRRLVDIFIVTAFCLCVLAIITMQLFMGRFRNKCVLWPTNLTTGYYDNLTDGADFGYIEHVLDSNNWYYQPGHLDPLACGNVSSAGVCPTGFTCLGLGRSPNYGNTNFDSFVWSLLSVFRILSQDFWENLFHVGIRTSGIRFTLVLLLVIFPTCFMVLSLLLAVLVKVTVDKDKEMVDKKRQKEEQFRLIQEVLMKKKEVPGSMASSQEASVTGAATEADVDTRPSSYWQRLRLWLRPFVLNPLFDLCIAICLIINTVVMATDHYPMTMQYHKILSFLQLVFFGIFVVEMILRMLALGLRGYFQVSWHILDFLVVVSSLLELSLADVGGLSALRCLRVLRMFRLARWWPTLQLLLKVVWCAAQGLTLVLLVLVFMWSIMGWQLFHDDYTQNVCKISDDCSLPRWHMADLPHAVMIVCRVLYGDWIELLWDCMEVSGPGTCVAYFIPMLLVGRLLVLFLFLNLLLSSTTNNELVALEDRIKLQTQTMTRMWRRARQNQSLDLYNTGERSTEESTGLTTLISDSGPVNDSTTEEDDKKHQVKDKFDIKQKLDERNLKDHTLEDCCCSCCPLQDVDTSRNWWRIWSGFRRGCLLVVENKVFEGFMVFVILLSSISLVVEDVHLEYNPVLLLVLDWADLIFTLVFLVEVLLKWSGFGFRKYFSDFYCCLDFLVLDISLLALLCQVLGVPCRPLRAVRTLRILSRFQGLKVVLRSLLVVLPSLLDVALVVLFLWLMFGIVGVNLYSGKLSYCINQTSEELFHHSLVNNQSDCSYLIEYEASWKNTEFHFDSVIDSYLSLLILGTSKSYADHLYSTIDSRGVALQPMYESRLYMSLYLLCFVVFGCFFGFLLFVRVSVRSFQKNTSHFGGKHVFMTEEQQIQSEGFKKRLNTPWTCPPPQNQCYNRFLALVSSRWFETAMMMVVFLDVMLLGLDHLHIEDEAYEVLHWFRLFLILVFLLEMVLKMAAFRCFYFSSVLNLVDVVVMLSSILSIFVFDLLYFYIFDFGVLVVLRLIRLTRFLWFFDATRGVRMLLQTFVMSLPALSNVGFLFIVVTLTFTAVATMAFGHVPPAFSLDDMVNFQTFWNSLVTMTMVSPWTGWDGLLLAIMDASQDCDLETPASAVILPCSTRASAIAFFLFYIILFILLIVLLFIAVVVESFNTTTPTEGCQGGTLGGASKAKGGAPEAVGGASNAKEVASEAVGGTSSIMGGATETV